MSNTFPISPDHNDTWDNPTTGESFKFDRHRGWINTKGVRYDGDTMTGTLVVPDTRINGGLLSAESVESEDDPEVMSDWVALPDATESLFCQWRAVTYADGKFVAVAEQGNINLVMYSEDGINWTGVPSSNDNNKWVAITYSEEKDLWVAIARGKETVPADKAVMYSKDAITWTGVRSIDDKLGWTGVAYGAGKFVAVSSKGKIMYSADAVTWTASRSPYPAYSLQGVTYGVGSDGIGRFVAVGGWETSTHRVAYSEDGITWTAVEPPYANDWYTVIHSEEKGLFVAVATNGPNKVMYSEDGISWTAVNTGSTDPVGWRGIAYGGGRFVTVSSMSATNAGGNNIIMYSTDAINWTGVPQPDGEWYLWDVAYSEEKDLFVIVTSSGDNRVMINDPPPIEGSDASDLSWNEEKVVVQQSSRTMTSSLSRMSSTISSRAGKAKYLQDSAPPETQTIELSEDSSETIDITYNNGELWYQPSTNTLHIRDSDDWVALFQ